MESNPPAPITDDPEAQLLFGSSFPAGYTRLPTPSEGNLCVLYALAASVEAHGCRDVPTIEELQIIALSDQMVEFEQAITGPSEEPRSLQHSFHVDRLGAILAFWGQLCGLDLQLGYLLQTGTPFLAPGPRTPSTRIVWISSTSDSGTDTEYLDHYEGLAPLAAPLQVPDDGEISDFDAPFSYLDDSSSDEFSLSDLSDGGESDSDVDPDTPGPIQDDIEPVIVEKGYVDGNGHIRIGPQPVKSHDPYVLTAPMEVSDRRIRYKVLHNMWTTDRKIPGATRDSLRLDSDEIVQYLGSTMTRKSDDQNRCVRVCDYTGLEMPWSSGPYSMSIEAIYPYVSTRGRIRYHAAPNVCLIASTLNWIQRQHPSLLLLLVAAWLNVPEEEGFTRRKERWRPSVSSKTTGLQCGLASSSQRGELFDPVMHFDLDRCTVTLDAVVTNMAMRNFSPDSWESIRSTLCSVPLNHSFWRVDLALGNQVWQGQWNRTIQPCAPVPDFDMPLCPIQAWTSGDGRSTTWP